MTVTRYANNFYQGLAADTKPTNVPAGAIYRATDTGDIYHYDGAEWDLIVGASKTETLTNKTILDSGSNQIGINMPFTFTIYRTASNYTIRNNWTGTLQTFSTSDFAPALEWAINNVVNAGTGSQSTLMGGAIFIKRGNYLATTTIEADIDTATRHGIQIWGEGDGTSIFFDPPSGTPITDGLFIEMQGFQLHNIRLKAANEYVTNIVRLTGHGGGRRNDYCIFENITFESPSSDHGMDNGVPISGQVGLKIDGSTNSCYFSTVRGCRFLVFDKGLWLYGQNATSCQATDNMSMLCETGCEISDSSGQNIIDGWIAQGEPKAGTSAIAVRTGAGGYNYIDHIIAELHRTDNGNWPPPDDDGTPVACQAVLLETDTGNIFVGKSISNSYAGTDPSFKVIVDNSSLNNHTNYKWNVDTKNLLTFNNTTDEIDVNASRSLVVRSGKFWIKDTTADNNYVFTAAGDLAGSRTITLPLLIGNDTLVFQAHTQTLTNKTLTTPTIAQIINSGTLTLPTSTDTLVGRATTDTLTNKTLTSPVINSPTLTNSGNTLTLPTSTDTLIGRDTTDTLTNKIISGSSNTISNIPDSALSANVALEDTANVFTALQTVQLNNTNLLNLYRPTNTQTSTNDIQFDFDSSNSTRRTFAKIRAGLVTNTDTSENGQLIFQTISGGTLTTKMSVNHNGVLFVGSNQRIALVEDGLSQQRVISFPNATTTLVGTDATQTLTNKTLGTTTMSDAANIVLNTTTGTKIGTATTQKLGFFNATPVTQRTFITSPDTTGAQLKTAVDAIRTLLSDLGLMAAS